MLDKEYITIDKSLWPVRGEWDNEPDKMQFTDETGYPCLIVRNRVGGLCGYVGVHKEHPFFEKEYGSVYVRVHGGLTFSSFCQETKDECKGVCHVVEEGEDDKVWWLGFDCVHGGDLAPQMRLYPHIEAQYPNVPKDIYRNLEYIKNEIKSLAKQIKEAA